MPLNYAILLPARNEEDGLPRVVPGCLEHRPADAILVVDDGSTDATSEVAAGYGVGVLPLRPGRGKGGALRAGFDRLITEGFDAILTIDSDGQHDTDAIPSFVEAMVNGPADLVIGARPRSVSLPRRFANWASSGLLSLAAGQRVEDAQSGYRLHRTRLLQELSLAGEGFGFETEILTRALAAKRPVRFVPIPTIEARRPSHIRPVRDVAPMIAQHVLLAGRMLIARALRPRAR